MPDRPLRIAWLGAGPSNRESGGVPGVATELLRGLAELGHSVDCFLPGAGGEPPPRVAGNERITFIYQESGWRWNRWYSRAKFAAFASSMLARSLSSLKLRREVARRHAERPYDVVYQFSNIETLSMPKSMRRTVPLVIHPETHIAGELRHTVAERELSLRSQPLYTFLVMVSIMSVRSLVQRSRIRRADLLVCISSVFRDHLVKDYGYPLSSTVVIPNPVLIDRFEPSSRPLSEPPAVVVLGRIAVRKGVEDVIAVCEELLERDVDARVRIVGGPSLSSDYTKLLDALPAANSEYFGRIPPSEIPGELARSDLLLQASRYEPFGLTVAEALAAGVPVVATSEVGAIEGVDRSVVTEVAPGDVGAMTSAVADMLSRMRADPAAVRAKARSEAQRLFAPEVVSLQVSRALGELVGRGAKR